MSWGQPWKPEWGMAVALQCPGRGLGVGKLLVVHVVAYLGEDGSLGTMDVLLQRQVEGGAEAGVEEAAALLLQKQPRSAVRTERCSSDPARRRRTLGLETWAHPHTVGDISTSHDTDIRLWGGKPRGTPCPAVCLPLGPRTRGARQLVPPREAKLGAGVG